MTSATDAASIPEPLPGHLKALLELNREAGTSFWHRDSHIYAIFGLLVLLYEFMAFRFHEAAAMFLAILLTFLFMLQRVNERREQRRLQLLLEVVRSLQPRGDATVRS